MKKWIAAVLGTLPTSKLGDEVSVPDELMET